MRKILIDSGPLLALFDASDEYYDKTVRFLKENTFPLVTTIASITEPLHLLDFNRNAQLDFLEWVSRGGVEFHDIKNRDFSRFKRTNKKISRFTNGFC